MKKAYLLTLSILFTGNIIAQKKGETITLFDASMSNFEKWIGTPHSSVKGLPPNTFQSDKVTEASGIPLGLNKDIKNVFSMIVENNEPVLKITGEIYGGVNTKSSYENYHLSVLFKWGDKKWEPRIKQLRDSGILYHCYGATWKTSLEYQVQETDMGDFIPLKGNAVTPIVEGPKVEIRGVKGKNRGKYDPNSDTYLKKPGYTSAYKEVDSPHGEWNHLEIYVISNDAVHVVNGEIVMVVENAVKADGTPLAKGQIQIQSEAAECYYKQLTLTGIKKFPKKIRKQVRFK